MTLLLQKIGPGASLQDKGRYGWQRYGVSASGPMDWLAASFANRMIGNPSTAPVVELDQMGVTAIAKTDCLVSLCVPHGTASLNGDDVFPVARLNLIEGDQLSIAPAKSGGWAYLALGGGISGHAQLGSVSYHRRAGLGGPPLSSGMTLQSHRAAHVTPLAAACFPLVEQAYATDTPFRLIMGPQDDRISAESLTRFCDGGFQLSLQCDRMGYRLTGEPLKHRDSADIVSDGIAIGAVQVPGDGHPIILMADRQTSGGYPKLGTIITADLPRLAQHAIGPTSKSLTFTPVQPGGAVEALKSLQSKIDQALAAPQPLGPRSLTTDILLRENLIDGVITDS